MAQNLKSHSKARPFPYYPNGPQKFLKRNILEVAREAKSTVLVLTSASIRTELQPRMMPAKLAALRKETVVGNLFLETFRKLGQSDERRNGNRTIQSEE